MLVGGQSDVSARVDTWSGIETGQGVSASTDLGKTAGVTGVRYLGRIPPAPMRTASLSHLKTGTAPQQRFVELLRYV